MNDFRKRLQQTADIVRSWPAWKRGFVPGGIVVERSATAQEPPTVVEEPSTQKEGPFTQYPRPLVVRISKEDAEKLQKDPKPLRVLIDVVIEE